MVDEHHERIGNSVGGILLLLAALLFAAVITFKPDDISFLVDPPSEHPHNILGVFGAWMAFICFQAFGLGAYILPAIFGLIGLIFLFRFNRKTLLKACWLAAIFLILVCILQLGTQRLQPHTAPLNMLDAGGVFGYGLTTGVLIRYLSFGVTAALLFMALLAMLILFFRIPIGHLFNQGLHAGRAGAARTREASSRISSGVSERLASRFEYEENEEEFYEEEEDFYDEEEEIEEEDHRERKRERRPSKLRTRSTVYPNRQQKEKSQKSKKKGRYEADPLPGARIEHADEFAEEDENDIIEFPETINAIAAVNTVPVVEDRPWESHVDDEDEEDAFPDVEEAPKPKKRKKSAKKKTAAKKAPAKKSQKSQKLKTNQAPSGPYRLPNIKLLDKLPTKRRRGNSHDISNRGAILVDTLGEFGVKATLTDARSGPVVTTYELLPAPGVRVEKIANLSNNIALALKAESIRVQAPIPGKGVVGIEIPNSSSTIVYAREIMESKEWERKRALPLLLGKDAVGREIVMDLADMPHLLIAGATGSGKSVCMNSLLAGLLMSRTPEQMRLLLVDPKIVEFTAFNDLPHLVTPVITDPKKVSVGLKWAIDEMTKRYKMFAKVGVRNIKSFNSRPKVQQTDMFDDGEEEEDPKSKTPDTVPYIVIVIDELADLMMVAQSDVENAIARLAQLSRAVGIHMVIATQRPSVNVITGTIKANFPARIAFQVAQKVDSRTILDANGADKLLGKGDMLLLPPGTSRLVRAQGAFTTDDEINRVVEFIKTQAAPEYETTVKEKIESKMPVVEENDADLELIEQAKEIIRQTQRASTSSLQRRLRIGYNRAARLMDKLEEIGVVGPPRGSDPREILIDLDGDIPKNENDYEEDEDESEEE